MRLYTIGFTKKSAEAFFGSLKMAGVKRVIDVRLHNESQLAGFAKRRDLEYFLRSCHSIEYAHEPLLAPTEEMLLSYRKKRIGWDQYAAEFIALLRQREVQTRVEPSILENACLLCSEARPEKCHRRLVAEYFSHHTNDLEIVHL
ncbi:MAG TPA: DUF488 domain-containing protein [Anaerolineales bacterium]|nr:DUF488 domain-containing protein [Anaerolineales bacterium]